MPWLRIPRFFLLRARLHAYVRLWPLTRPLAALHRASLARRLRVVAVIGSFGKSTTTRAVAAALGAPADGWLNAFAAIDLALLASPPWQRHLVKEVGIARPGQMARYGASLKPDIVVFTSVGSEHNRSLGSLEEIAAEKARMFDHLAPGGTIVANGDDPRVRAVVEGRPQRVVRFGFHESCEVRIVDYRVAGPEGSAITVETGGCRLSLRCRLLGRDTARAFAAALAVADLEGVSRMDAVRRLEQIRPVPGRLELISLGSRGHLLRDDCKGAFETFESAIRLLGELSGRRIAVVGEVENPPQASGPTYRSLGAQLGAVAERVVVVGGRKLFQAYRSGARKAGFDGSRFLHAGHSVARAAEHVRGELGPDSLVLIKGASRHRLQRVGLLLEGERVDCRLVECEAPGRVLCRNCRWRLASSRRARDGAAAGEGATAAR